MFDFVAERTSGTSLEVATSLAYPLGDILMIAMIMGVVALTGFRPDRTWALLLAGLAAMVVADIAYSIQSTSGIVPAGNWIDPLYLVSAAFWAATTAAIFLRLTASVRENRDLFEKARSDPLTSLLNRGAIQVDLEDLCRRASSDHSLMLALFDLNGFKRFNDSFGHPAGDELLAGFGRRLREALSGDGTPYRIGGDEFCVLFTCGIERFDEALRRSTGALTSKGSGYSVGVSWGVVRVPDEASTPSEAMRLADLRMYAQKESRRIVRDGRGEPRPLPAGS